MFVVEAGGWAPLAPFSLEKKKSTGLSAAVPDHCSACPLSQTVEKMEKVPLPLNEATAMRGWGGGTSMVMNFDLYPRRLSS